MERKQRSGSMTVQEAGQKGGRTTSQRYGRGFYHEIGLKGGNMTRELVEAGKRASGMMGEGSRRGRRSM